METLLGPRGRSDWTQNYSSTLPLETSGWPTANTALRYTAAALGLATILTNLLPFWSATAAYVLGFSYAADSVLCFCAFAWDLDALLEAGDYPCPTAPDGVELVCTQLSFIATCSLDAFAGVILLAYLVIEYWYMQKYMIRLPQYTPTDP